MHGVAGVLVSWVPGVTLPGWGEAEEGPCCGCDGQGRSPLVWLTDSSDNGSHHSLEWTVMPSFW